MKEQDEIYLRRVESTWQSRQNSAGVATLFLGFLTVCAFLLFVWAPSQRSAWIMGGLMALLLAACARLISAASKVVEIRKLHQPAHSNAEVIDAEVVDSRDCFH